MINKYILIKLFLINIHLFVIFVSAYLLLFLKNPYILLAQFIIQAVVFIGIVLLNGCMLTKLEASDSIISATYIGKQIFFIDEPISDASFEKFFVGVPLGLLLLKIILILSDSDKYINLIEKLI